MEKEKRNVIYYDGYVHVYTHLKIILFGLLLSPAGAVGPEILQRPPVRLSVCLSVTFSFRTVNFLHIEKNKIVSFLFSKNFMFSSRFMLFPTFKKKKLVSKKMSGGGGGVEFVIFFISRRRRRPGDGIYCNAPRLSVRHV